MNENHFWNLLAKHLSGEASAQEVAELEALMKAHPSLSYAAQHLTDLWKLAPAVDCKEAEASFAQHMAKLAEQDDAQPASLSDNLQTSLPQKRWLKKPGLYLALAACILAAIVWLRPSQTAVLPKPQTQTAEISTRAGNRTRLVLPDSSVVWLNAGSKLTYNPAFGVSHRNTTLTGEAFFDVRKSTIPFVIQANGVKIKVLGTAFNVKSYPNEEKTETTLLRGRIEVILDKRPAEPIILKPNEKLIVANITVGRKASSQTKLPLVLLKELTPVGESLVAETSWVENKLVFQDETFAEVARKMERWYDVKITIANDGLAAQKVGGGPFENETVSQALEALRIAFDFKFSINGKQITITK